MYLFIQSTAEVGLLSRNIVVRGSDDHVWHDPIENCEEGFETGQFATQTCFQVSSWLIFQIRGNRICIVFQEVYRV